VQRSAKKVTGKFRIKEKLMTRLILYSSSILALVLGLFLAASSNSQSTPPSPSGAAPPIGARVIEFSDDQVTPNRFAVRAFVATGSLSNPCLATLAESNFAIPGISVFCGPREFQGQRGVLLSAFFPEPIPSGLILSATIYQEHARGYGAPVFFCGDGGDGCPSLGNSVR
jgi:hypothetical protein